MNLNWGVQNRSDQKISIANYYSGNSEQCFSRCQNWRATGLEGHRKGGGCARQTAPSLLSSGIGPGIGNINRGYELNTLFLEIARIWRGGARGAVSVSKLDYYIARGPPGGPVFDFRLIA